MFPNDSLNGGSGGDLVLGGDNNNDNISGGTSPRNHPDTVAGQDGNDTIFDPSSQIDEAFTFDFAALLK